MEPSPFQEVAFKPFGIRIRGARSYDWKKFALPDTFRITVASTVENREGRGFCVKEYYSTSTFFVQLITIINKEIESNRHSLITGRSCLLYTKRSNKRRDNHQQTIAARYWSSDACDLQNR